MEPYLRPTQNHLPVLVLALALETVLVLVLVLETAWALVQGPALGHFPQH